MQLNTSQSKTETSNSCKRQSRPKQRYQNRPYAPLHHQQLEQIKTQYLSHQHDITIDRETVLKINRLATRRSLHKREHSWPPISSDAGADSHIQYRYDATDKQHTEHQHVRCSSSDNSLQFDKTVCKRYAIDGLREKFNSPTRIIEPSDAELRHHILQQHRTQPKRFFQGDMQIKDWSLEEPQLHVEAVITNSQNQSNNAIVTNTGTKYCATELIKSRDCSNTNITSLVGDRRKVKIYDTNEIDKKKHKENGNHDNDLLQPRSLPGKKGLTLPETKAANEDLGLVEPRRQFYEQLTSSKKWYSYENLNDTSQYTKPKSKYVYTHQPKRQSNSWERGRDTKHFKRQLPPQKPRIVECLLKPSKLQRRSIKMATEIKICYDADAEDHKIQVKSLNKAKNCTTEDLENIPLPQLPAGYKPRKLSDTAALDHQAPADIKCSKKDEENQKSLTDAQMYDGSCIYLRSIDLQDNTVAYIPAAITIVPSPRNNIQQNRIESVNLKAEIKDLIEPSEKTANLDLAPASITGREASTTDSYYKKHENLINCSYSENVKRNPEPVTQQHEFPMNKQNIRYFQGPETYVTRLPSTPKGMQLSRQSSVNTKRKYQLNNNTSSCSIETPKTPKDDTSYKATTTKTKKTQVAIHQGDIHSNASTPISTTTLSSTTNVLITGTTTDGNGKTIRNISSDRRSANGIYYTDGEYLYGPYDPSNVWPLSSISIRALHSEHHQYKQQTPGEEAEHHQDDEHRRQPKINVGIETDIESETIKNNQQTNEIANLTAKYEHIQKSITEHLRHIDAYIENAKTALKSAITTPRKETKNDKKTISKQQQLHQECLRSRQHSLELRTKNSEPLHTEKLHENNNYKLYPTNETPLQEILRKVSTIMQDLQPFDQIQSKLLEKERLNLDSLLYLSSQGPENTEIVDKVLTDLNMLTIHLKKCDTTAEVVPTSKKLQLAKVNAIHCDEKPFKISYDNRPMMQKVLTANIIEGEGTKNLCQAKGHSDESKIVDKCINKSEMSIGALQSFSRHQNFSVKPEHVANYDQLSVTGMPELSYHQKPLYRDPSGRTVLEASSKNVEKKVVSNFRTTRHKPEQLVDQVIDILDRSANVATSHEDDLLKINNIAHISNNYIKSNVINTASSQSLSKSNIKKCMIPINKYMFNQTFTQDSAHDKAFSVWDTEPQPHHSHPLDRCSESRPKLDIKDLPDIMFDKQFQNDDRLQMKFTNKPTDEKDDNHNCSNVELDNNTYKSSYELPSPSVMTHQISWKCVQTKGVPVQTIPKIAHRGDGGPGTNQGNDSAENSAATAVANMKIAEVLVAGKTRTSGHSEMQSTIASNSRIQTGEQFPPHHHQLEPQAQTHLLKQKAGEQRMIGRQKLLHLIEPHIPTCCSTSPFTLNVVEAEAKQRTPSPSLECATKSGNVIKPQGHDELMHAIRKYPTPLMQPNLATRSTSPVALNSVESKPSKRSTSISPLRYSNCKYSDGAANGDKFSAPLAEKHPTTRAPSPYGLNVVEFVNITPTARRSRVLSPYRIVEEPPRKYPALLAGHPTPNGFSTLFGVNHIDFSSTCPSPKLPSFENEHRPNTSTSAIRKYPGALNKPYSPTGETLNDIDSKKHNTTRSPSPARDPPTTNNEAKKLSLQPCMPQSETKEANDIMKDMTTILPRYQTSSSGKINVATTKHNCFSMTSHDIAVHSCTNIAAKVDFDGGNDDNDKRDEFQCMSAIGTSSGTGALFLGTGDEDVEPPAISSKSSLPFNSKKRKLDDDRDVYKKKQKLSTHQKVEASFKSYETKETTNLNIQQLQRLVLLKQNKVLSLKLDKLQKERDGDVAPHFEEQSTSGPNNSDNEREEEIDFFNF